jgi:phosphoribosylformylglycinamidine synthase subunit PurSL
VLPPVLPDGRKSADKKPVPGDRVVIVGGAVGADGIHGATFSSMEMNENAPATAVQIGDPITQKRAMDFLLEARDLGLYSAITDNGAGGISSSVGEMATMTDGARIDLALCPVKYPGLSPWELMVSESQERMTVAVPERHIPAFLDLARRRGVSASDIGAFTDDGELAVFYGAAKVCGLSLAFLHDSLPPLRLRAEWDGPRARTAWSGTSPDFRRKSDAATTGAKLLALLSSPTITSKEKWVRAYDHEVQAATHVKPFIGKERDAPSDSGVIWLAPHGGSEKNGAAIGCGMAPRLSPFDPYLMAQYAVDEAVRNVVASGADPDMLCLLDNFCWPDPVESKKNPDGAYKMGQLVRACQGLFDICKAYGAPLVSGKDSMKNDFRGKDKRGEQITISILPTLMVTAMARADMGIAPGSDFKAAGDLVYLLGGEGVGLAGSEYAELFGGDGVPGIDLARNIALYRAIYRALQAGLLRSVHDVSEGGLLVALAESAIGGRLGFAAFAALDDAGWFSEAAGRFVVSVATDQKDAFEKAFAGAVPLGTVGGDVLALGGEAVALADVVAAWKKGF